MARLAGSTGGRAGGIIDAAALLREHYDAAAASFRKEYGLPIAKLGTSECLWREALALTRQLLEHTDTWLAQAVGELDYPASQIDLVHAALLIGLTAPSKAKASEMQAKLLPFGHRKKATPKQVDAAAYTEATNTLLAQFGIDPTVAAADIAAHNATN